jgi:hypothetical protein
MYVFLSGLFSLSASTVLPAGLFVAGTVAPAGFFMAFVVAGLSGWLTTVGAGTVAAAGFFDCFATIAHEKRCTSRKCRHEPQCGGMYTVIGSLNTLLTTSLQQ